MPLKTQAPPVVSLQAKRWGEIQKWSYVRPVNRLIGDIKPYHNVVSNLHFNQSGSSKISLDNSQKNKLTNNQYQSSLKIGFKSILPINLQTYEGQIKGETLFMKLKEIGNYNVLIKKKNTLFKTLILKMNSSLRPLSSVNLGAEKKSLRFLASSDSFDLNGFFSGFSFIPFFVAPCQRPGTTKSREKIDSAKRLSFIPASVFQNHSLKHGRVFGLNSQTKDANKQVSQLHTKSDNWRSIKNRPLFIKRKLDNSSQKKGNDDLFSIDKQFLNYNCDAYFLTNTIANATEKANGWNQDFIFEKENMFPSFGQNFTFDKEQQEKKFQKNSQATDLEFFRVWLFLDTVHCSHLHWFNHLQNKHKVDPTLITKKLALHRRRPIEKSPNQNSFPKILQFYKYRKNFLLKKIFKQRVRLTQYSIWEPWNTPVWESKQGRVFCLESQTKHALDRKRITKFKPIEGKQYQNIAFKIIPTIKKSLAFFNDLNKFAYWRENLIFSQSALTDSHFGNSYPRWVLQNGNCEKKTISIEAIKEC